MCRLNLVQGLGPALQIAEGWTVELPDNVHEILDERTDPTWPTTWFVPRTTGSGPFRDVYTVMNNWGANHGAIGYGHIGADLISLCLDAAHPGLHAQRARGADLPPQRLDACSAPTSPWAPTSAPAPTSGRCTADPQPHSCCHFQEVSDPKVGAHLLEVVSPATDFAPLTTPPHPFYTDLTSLT